MINRQALTFEAAGEELVGIIDAPAKASREGILIVVGGPQYRVGSHRQFTLLARSLAASGVAAMRFDHRGIGDSTGDETSFEDIGPDIAAALDAFVAACPEVTDVTIWGLCDAASAACINAGSDARIKKLVLLNPWFRADGGLSRGYLMDHYLGRLTSGKFWRDLISGRVNVLAPLKNLFGSSDAPSELAAPETAPETSAPLSYQERMFAGLRMFDGKILLVLSGEDVTAREFESETRRDRRWRRLLRRPQVQIERLSDANHTFGNRLWRDRVAALTLAFLRDH